MLRFLILLGAILILIGAIYPFLQKLGIGKLPGDIYIQKGNFTFYFPITTSILVSVVLSLLFWFVNRH
jgi:hypothetical protein